MNNLLALGACSALSCASGLAPPTAIAQNQMQDPLTANGCGALPDHATVRAVLAQVVPALAPPGAEDPDVGFGNEVWMTVLDRDGIVCAVTYSGADRGDQWPGGRLASAVRANTANNFSLPAQTGLGGPLSSANLYAAAQPGGSLSGFDLATPVNPIVASRGNPARYGQANDPMTGGKIGGASAIAGGLALYAEGGELLGALGVAGDSPCTDHFIAWRVRDGLALDFLPDGPIGGTDNMFFDFGEPDASGLGYTSCIDEEEPLVEALPQINPLGTPMGPPFN